MHSKCQFNDKRRKSSVIFQPNVERQCKNIIKAQDQVAKAFCKVTPCWSHILGTCTRIKINFRCLQWISYKLRKMILIAKYCYGILFIFVLVAFRIVSADVPRTELSAANEVYTTDDAVFINGKFNIYIILSKTT